MQNNDFLKIHKERFLDLINEAEEKGFARAKDHFGLNVQISTKGTENDPDANVRISKERLSDAIRSAERSGYFLCADMLFTQEAKTAFGEEVRKIGQWLTERIARTI
jgi:hypothetical protein